MVLGEGDLRPVFAIALPFAGVLAKIFSELIDEAPRAPAHALRGAGAPALSVFFVGLVPAALPDMLSYTFYRFECALRSAAVLGFFGYETLGAAIQGSWESGHYREVWLYLYVLVALVYVFDQWGGALRRRLDA